MTAKSTRHSPLRSTIATRRTSERAKVDKPRTSVPTLKDLMSPQTRHLFTINYDITTMPRESVKF